MIERLSFVSVIVKDQVEALDFYVGKLGFEKRRDYSFPNLPRFLTVAPKGQAEPELVLVLAGGSTIQAHGGHTGIVFSTPDCRAEVEELSRRGVHFTTPPTELPFGVQAQFVDPSGNLFSLTQPRGV